MGTVALLADVAGRFHGQAEGYRGTVLIPEVKVQQLPQEGKKQKVSIENISLSPEVINLLKWILYPNILFIFYFIDRGV